MDRILTYCESNGVSETYAYDNYGSLSSVTQNENRTYTYTYNEDSTRTLKNILVKGLTIIPKYDTLKRNKGKEVHIDEKPIVGKYITYRKVGDHMTNMPSTIRFGHKIGEEYVIRDSLKYGYDSVGNIEKIFENGKLIVTYTYDKLNRLVRENNKKHNKTTLFAYDNNGNILLKEEYAYTVKEQNELSEAKVISEYCYKESSDQLLRIIKNELQENGEHAETIETFAYDTLGNPTTYRGKTATWIKGRYLTSYDNHTFTYDARGRLIEKDGIVFTYSSNGKLIKRGNDLEFLYDHTGVVGFIYNNEKYLYRKDVQGNIVAILSVSGNILVEYTYDAWGKAKIEDVSGIGLGEINPFRYRGYYYDNDIKMYYLKTRYYDPEIGRFMTIDSISYLNPNVINGLNLYAYCGNNPVMGVDPNGNAWWNPFSWDWGKVGDFFDSTAQKIKTSVSSIKSQVKASIVSLAVDISRSKLGTFVRYLATDIRNYDINNTDPQKVIDAHYFSAYKGQFAVKLPIGEDAFSFGIMGIGNDIDDIKNTEHINTILHEYGHYLQLQEMGWWNYICDVAIPSVTGNRLESKGKLKVGGTAINYYSQPWEYEADQLGGVVRCYPGTATRVKLVSLTYWDLIKMF